MFKFVKKSINWKHETVTIRGRQAGRSKTEDGGQGPETNTELQTRNSEP